MGDDEVHHHVPVSRCRLKKEGEERVKAASFAGALVEAL